VHARKLHEERAASTLNEQPTARDSSSIDDSDAPQDEAAAATDFDGTRQALGVDGHLAAQALEGEVDPAHTEGSAAEEVDSGKQMHHGRGLR
jgi:hypothetical protein